MKCSLAVLYLLVPPTGRRLELRWFDVLGCLGRNHDFVKGNAKDIKMKGIYELSHLLCAMSSRGITPEFLMSVSFICDIERKDVC